MPITEFMNGFRTDPETRRLMGLAFELTRVTLRLSDRNDPLIQLVADRMLSLRRAERGSRNAFVIWRWPASSPRRAPRVDNKRPPGCWHRSPQNGNSRHQGTRQPGRLG